MIAIILRIVLGLLAAGFIAWYLYITWLGLKTFFGLESDDVYLEKSKNNNKTTDKKKETTNGQIA